MLMLFSLSLALCSLLKVRIGPKLWMSLAWRIRLLNQHEVDTLKVALSNFEQTDHVTVLSNLRVPCNQNAGKTINVTVLHAGSGAHPKNQSWQP